LSRTSVRGEESQSLTGETGHASVHVRDRRNADSTAQATRAGKPFFASGVSPSRGVWIAWEGETERMFSEVGREFGAVFNLADRHRSAYRVAILLGGRLLQRKY